MIEKVVTRVSDQKVDAELKAWPYRLGMSVYKAGISAFFACGGLSRLKKKYEIGLEERIGNFGPHVPKNALWVHAVSVGEVQSALSLIEAAKAASGCPCILSTVTTTGRNMAEKLTRRAGEPLTDALTYYTWDTPRFVSRALDALAPRAYVAMETERWPTLLAELRKRKIPAFLVNGRLSDKSVRKLRFPRTFWRGVLCCFDLLMVRFESDRENFLSLGVPREKVIVTGDCKVDSLFERKKNLDPAKWRHLRNDENPLFLAGSTHPGEDEIVLEAFDRVREVSPGSRLIIAPRHPERASFVAEASRPHGKTAILTNLTQEWDIVVVDKIGVLFELYSVVDAAFIGGSLIPRGGQNLMEPALFGLQTTHGPDMSNFPDAARMDKIGAARVVENAARLAEAWLDALDLAEIKRARRACEDYFDSVGGAAARSWNLITSSTSRN